MLVLVDAATHAPAACQHQCREMLRDSTGLSGHVARALMMSAFSGEEKEPKEPNHKREEARARAGSQTLHAWKARTLRGPEIELSQLRPVPR